MALRRLIEGILKDEDHYGRLLPLTVTLTVDRVATAARFDYVELLKTLIVLDVLRDDVVQLLKSAVRAIGRNAVKFKWIHCNLF
jgi:hypothetical protein